MIKYYNNPFDLPSIFSDNVVINNNSYFSNSSSKSEISKFLIKFGLKQYIKLFEEQEVDFDTLKKCTKEDFKMIGIPIGPSILIKHLLENNIAL
jgi:hypothetical protein